MKLLSLSPSLAHAVFFCCLASDVSQVFGLADGIGSSNSSNGNSSTEQGVFLPFGRQIPVSTSEQTVRPQPVVEFIEVDFDGPSASAAAAAAAVEPGVVRQTGNIQEEAASESSFFSSFNEFESPAIAFSRKAGST
ncbi:hypothetical protein, conserved [Eimeria praecox]|uniref:Uncharacterized protein n=1 Tax=Eimeria praecox TaxID=51316 RepID=U6GLW4_9EIME|nr:hypothetical protein, conserved [Eimeria praecox]